MSKGDEKWTDPAQPPVFREVVQEKGDPTPEMRYRPPTYRELRERVDRRPVGQGRQEARRSN